MPLGGSCIKEQITAFLKDHQLVVVDIRKVSYLDSSGIGLLIYIAKTVYGGEGKVKFVVPSGFVFDVLRMVHGDREGLLVQMLDPVDAATTGRGLVDVERDKV